MKAAKEQGLVPKDLKSRAFSNHLTKEKVKIQILYVYTINVFCYLLLFALYFSFYSHLLETKQDVADFFDSTLETPSDPTTPYTIHHHSGPDDDGQWRFLAVISSESELYS